MTLHTKPARHTTRRAFTLMEMLIVVAIIVILAGVGTFYILPQFNKAKEDTARWIVGVDAAIAGVADQQGTAERTEIRRRQGESPRRVERTLGGEAPHQVARGVVSPGLGARHASAVGRIGHGGLAFQQIVGVEVGRAVVRRRDAVGSRIAVLDGAGGLVRRNRDAGARGDRRAVVREVDRAARFYTEVLGMELIAREEGLNGAFLRLARSGNHHDLGLFGIPGATPRPPRSLGLYHLAWQLDTVDELVEFRERDDLVEFSANLRASHAENGTVKVHVFATA